MFFCSIWHEESIIIWSLHSVVSHILVSSVVKLSFCREWSFWHNILLCTRTNYRHFFDQATKWYNCHLIYTLMFFYLFCYCIARGQINQRHPYSCHWIGRGPALCEILVSLRNQCNLKSTNYTHLHVLKNNQHKTSILKLKDLLKLFSLKYYLRYKRRLILL